MQERFRIVMKKEKCQAEKLIIKVSVENRGKGKTKKVLWLSDMKQQLCVWMLWNVVLGGH